jgi:inner membrane transporter RhtA
MMAEETLPRANGAGTAQLVIGKAKGAPAWSLAAIAMLSVQIGSALSTGLFAQVGTAGTAWLRLTAGALMFLAYRRPRLRGRQPSELGAALALGAATGAMSVCFLAAIDRVPLGTAVAIEYMGPFAVAVGGTRTLRGFAWPLLALAGVLALTEPWTGSVDPLGILWAAGAAAGWALYILLSAKVGGQFEGIDGLSITIPIAAAASAIVGLPEAVGHLSGPVMLAAVGIALLTPVLPYSLEMLALRRLTTTAFGTLMALEPAIGMAVGIIVLAQAATALQVAGIGLVVIAGIAVTRQDARVRLIDRL